MHVPIIDIENSPGLWKEFSAQEKLDCPDFETKGPITVKVRITNAGTRMLVQGSAEADLMIRCARCDEEYPERIEIELEEGFVPSDSPEADAEGLEAFEILTYQEDRIVLDEMLRQNFLAAVPLQPICRQGECRGLCDQCGTDLNTSECECKLNDIDPRWTKLQDLEQRYTSGPNLN